MEHLTVSVIVPAYRAEHVIARALSSALAQTRPPDEILVIDDGSCDGTANVVAGFKDRVTLIEKPNGGAASARNLGIERSRGDIIAFLDADDYWEPNKLERQLEVFERDPDVGVVGCRWFQEPVGQTRFLSPVRHERFIGKLLKLSGDEAFQAAMCMWTGAVAVRKTSLGEHRFQSGLEPAEDRDLWVRLASNCAMFFLDEPLATYVVDWTSLSRSDANRDCGNMLRVARHYGELIGASALRAEEAVIFRRWAARHLRDGRPDQAITPALHRLGLKPASAEAWWVVAKSLVWAASIRLGKGTKEVGETMARQD